MRPPAALALGMVLVLAPAVGLAIRGGEGDDALALTGLVGLELVPSEVHLDGARARGRVVVLGRFADGALRDLSETALLATSDPAVVALDGTFAIPRGDGAASITARVGEHRTAAPVTVAGQEAPGEIDFLHEVLPALTMPGCNSGACHGSPSGRGGFSLSLFAYDPESDHAVLTRGGFARRVDPLEPVASLLLRKPTLAVSHGGGQRLIAGDPRHSVLQAWIAEGARWERSAAAELVGLEILPAGALVRGLDAARQPLIALARFSDGRARDVTELVSWFSTNTAVATVDAAGVVHGVERGQGAVVARYLDRLVSKPVTIVAEVPGYAWVARPEAGPIDRAVNAKLRELRYVAGETCDDATFLRRAAFDLTGLLPTVERTRAFLADGRADKRARLVDELLAGEAHARHWARQRGDLLRITRERLKSEAEPFAAWLVDAWRTNRPYDEVARALIEGRERGRRYYDALKEPETRAEATAQVFLGSRLECAKCHNHPYESWTQDQYYEIATSLSDDVTHPRTKATVAPWRGGGAGADVKARRAAFADWLTMEDPSFFARVEANRIWAQLFGRGIVEPVDDFRSSNPPSNPELLDLLEVTLRLNGFDRAHLIRAIVLSQTYQRVSGATPESEPELELFSRQHRRLLPAEALLDAVSRVTEEEHYARLAEELGAAERALAELEERLAPGLEPWVADREEALAREAELVLGPWRALGPFEVDGAPEAESVFAHDFGPEASADPGAMGFGEREWVERPEWGDGEVHPLGLPASSAMYLLRAIEAQAGGSVELSLGSDDGLRVWVNGREALARDVARGARPDQDRVTVELRAGLNEVLLKVVNRGGASGFCFSASATRTEETLAALLRTPAEGRGEDWRAALRAKYFAAQPELAAQVAELDRLRAEAAGRFATQALLPTEDGPAARREFLRAFGQPPRETSCACERQAEPTLTQALQLLNGAHVVERVARGAAAYAELDDEAAVERLFLAAYCRPPGVRERELALAHLAASSDRGAAMQDLVWAVLNSLEFATQH